MNVLTHLEESGMLVNNQHGIRSGQSYESQLNITSQDISKYLDSKFQVNAELLDFSKAFDKVPHTRLLNKLEYYGMRGSHHKWTSAF